MGNSTSVCHQTLPNYYIEHAHVTGVLWEKILKDSLVIKQAMNKEIWQDFKLNRPWMDYLAFTGPTFYDIIICFIVFCFVMVISSEWFRGMYIPICCITSTEGLCDSEYSGFGISQWGTTLHYNIIFIWPSPYPEWSRRLFQHQWNDTE